MFERYAELEHLLASAQLALAMLGMGALLTPADFAGVVRQPRGFVLGLGAQLVAVPLVALAVASALPVPPGIAAGLVLVAAVPGGTLSNVATYLGLGNIALSIALTTVCTLAALVTTPLLLELLAGAHLPGDFEMPVGRVAWEIGVTLLAPLLAGMAAGNAFPGQRARISRWGIRGSLAVIGVMVVGAAGAGRLDPRAYGSLGIAAVFGFCLAAQLVALALGRLARLGARDRLAVVIEVTIRNTNLAILVKASLFPAVAGVPDPIGDGMFFVALLYGGAALPVAAGPILTHRRGWWAA